MYYSLFYGGRVLEIIVSIIFLRWEVYNSSPGNYFMFCALIYRMSTVAFAPYEKVMWQCCKY